MLGDLYLWPEIENSCDMACFIEYFATELGRQFGEARKGHRFGLIDPVLEVGGCKVEMEIWLNVKCVIPRDHEAHKRTREYHKFEIGMGIFLLKVYGGVLYLGMRLCAHVFVASTEEIVFGVSSRSEAKPLKLASVTLNFETFCLIYQFHDPALVPSIPLSAISDDFS